MTPRLCFADLETQSTVNLRAVGSKAYLKHDTTRLLSAVFLLDGVVTIWVPPGRSPDGVFPEAHADLWPKGFAPLEWEDWQGDNPPPAIRSAILDGVPFVGHNAEHFDAIAWRRFAPGSQPEWLDTIHLCRAAGLPAGLDKACKALGIEGKDEAGKEALKLLYTIKPGKPPNLGTVGLWRLMLRYNIQDVLILAQLYAALPPSSEPDLIKLHERINKRGVPIDLRFAEIVRDLWEVAQGEARDVLDELTAGELTGDDARSTVKVKAWLAKMGKPVDTLRREQVEQLLAGDYFGDVESDPVAAKIEAVIQARQLAARATVGKVRRVFAAVDDDARCRDTLVYHAAHTGRFAGRDLQPHNMPRGIPLDMESLLATYHATDSLTLDDVRTAAGPAANIGDAVATLMRPILRAPKGKRFVVVDYSQVEARAAMWLAKEPAGLAAFRDPKRDIYLDTAAVLAGRPVEKKDPLRQIAKVCVLGSIYSLSGPKFEVYCGLQGIDLTKHGLDGPKCIAAFRATYPALLKWWRGLTNAALWAVRGEGVASSHRTRFVMDRGSLSAVLPSGRKLIYRQARIVPGKFGTQVQYTHVRGYPCDMWAGKWAENISSALCRDMLCDAMLRLDSRYPVVLHVHDEAVFEVGEDIAETALHEICREMSLAPEWADGFPLRVEGAVCEHYTKSPLRGFAKAEYMMGEKL